MTSRFTIGARVTDGLIKGVVTQLDPERRLCVFEHEVWPGEPKRRDWISEDRLMPCPAGMTIEQAVRASRMGRAA